MAAQSQNQRYSDVPSSRRAASTDTNAHAPIAIIGAGPAGLLLARFFERSRIAYTVFERDQGPEIRSGSGTLDVRPITGQLALKQAGLLDRFNALARHGVSTTIVDAQANVLLNAGGKDDKERPEIDRRDLQRLLQEAVPLDKVVWGSKIEKVSRAADGVMTIHMADQTTQSGFRLVIGADGAWSKVRPLLTPAVPQYSGIVFYTTYVQPDDAGYPVADSLAQQGNYLAMSGTRKIFLHYLSDRSYFLSVGLDVAEGQSDKSSLQNGAVLWESLLKDKFQDWTPKLVDLVRLSHGAFRAWPLYNLPVEAVASQWTSVQGVTLVGDAAHLT